MSRPGPTQMPFTEDEMSVARAEIESMRAHWEHDQQGGHEIQKLAISKRRRAKHARWWKYLDDCDYGLIRDGRDDAIWKRLYREEYTRLSPFAPSDFREGLLAPALAECNAQVPLSPIHISSGASEVASSEDEDELDERIDDNHFRIGVQRWNRYWPDHQRACGGSLLPVPAVSFQFMRLPREIRHRVLSLLLKQKDEFTQNTVNSIAPEQGCRNPHKLWPVDVHVFAVCQQMRLEAEKVFYEQNTFHVDATGSLPLFVRKAVEDKTPGSILGLRRIHIRIPYERRGCHVMRQSQEERLEKLEILSDFLVKCRNLRRVKFTALCWSHRLDWEMSDATLDREFTVLTECFAKVKGVEKVVIGEINERYSRKEADFRPMGSPSLTTRLKAIMQSQAKD